MIMRGCSHYLFTWFFGLALIFPTLPTNAGDAVPVLIWGGGETNGSRSISVNPLQKTSNLEFEKMVKKKVGGSQKPILVFIRDNFCVEDFTQHKEGLMHLNDDGTLDYLPAVDSPLSVFKSLSSYNQSLQEELETVSEGQVVITKAADLDAISETFNMVKESSPNLIAVLTGKSCTYSKSERIRRATDESTSQAPKLADDSLPVIKTKRILLYYAALPTLNLSLNEVNTGELLEVKQEGEGTLSSPLALNFVFSIKNATSPLSVSIILKFEMNSTSYYIAQAYYQDKNELVKLITQSHFVFPYNVSYHCSGNVRFYRKEVLPDQQGIDFFISNFQIQIDPKNSSFNYAVDCVGFTSVPIWSGLFVTFILGIIMIWGLTMIMDIRTMDRFDDPKGKTITVTASE